MTLRLHGIDHPIGSGRRLRVDDLELPLGTSVLFGPNGSGKTTLIRILAGTLPGGPEIPVAYLPQRPHVFRGPAVRTLLLGLAADLHPGAFEIARRLGIEHVLDRRSTALSGGERRRIALARTLAGSDSVVALDEPFADIAVADLPTVRAVVRDSLVGRTSVIVTHDRTDAAALGDRLIVLIDGTVRQVGPVEEVLALPGDEMVAGALGTANLLLGRVMATEDGTVAVDTSAGVVWGMGDLEVGSRAVAIFGAESVTVFLGSKSSGGSARNRWSGRVAAVRQVGRLVEIDVVTGGPRHVVALLTPGSVDALGVRPGIEVDLTVKAASVRVVGR